MGVWLTRHLTGLGRIVEPVDRARGEAEIVIVSVPIKVTGDVVSQVIMHMSPSAVIAEIASLKAGVMASLRLAAEKGLRPLCIHPMFGPQTQHLKGKVGGRDTNYG